MTGAEHVQVRDLDVVRLILEPELERPAVKAVFQERGRLTVQSVHERLQFQPVPRVGHAAVLERRPSLDVEWPESRVNDPLGTGNSAGQDDRLPPIGELVVRARIELWLQGSSVLERGVGDLRARNSPGRPQKRFLRQHARRHLVGKPVARRLRMHGADCKESRLRRTHLRSGSGRTGRIESTRSCPASRAASS